MLRAPNRTPSGSEGLEISFAIPLGRSLTLAVLFGVLGRSLTLAVLFGVLGRSLPLAVLLGVLRN